MSEESTENNANEFPKSINEVIPYIKKNFIILLTGFLGVGGTTGGVAFSDVIHESFIEYVAEGLAKHHNIKPFLVGLDAELKSDSTKLAEQDSINEMFQNHLNYQMGFNTNVAMSKMVDTIIDGIPMKHNVETNTNWVTWDGYTYLAVNEGNGNWAIFLFQWQLPKGADNHFPIDPQYYQFQ